MVRMKKGLIKRLIIVVGFFPVLMITFPFEMIFYSIRYILTGKGIDEVTPIFVKFIEW